MFSFDALALEERRILDSVPSLIENAFPVPGRFRRTLPSDIAGLSKMLTDGRGQRSLSYLTRPNYLSAYLRYYLPWNLCRLCIILPNLDIPLECGGTVTDLGSGPLTFACALWISRPGLRAVPIEFDCVDRSAPALEAGKKFFNALSAGNCKWKINLIKEDIDFRKPAGGRTGIRKKPDLLCAVNIFNEIYESIPHNNASALKKMAEKTALYLHYHASERTQTLTVEPGVPQSGKFISLLRDELNKLGHPPASPCPHTLACPLLTGGRQSKRWCHFAADAKEAPKELHRLSAAAGIPKERLVFSYLLTGKAKQTPALLRVISDPFALPDYKFGRYCCSERGLVLLCGEKRTIEKTVSGSLVTPNFAGDGQRDKKSGALLAFIK